MRQIAWGLALLATGVLGCGSLRPAILLDSARAAYPDCDEIAIGERDEGVRQWLVVCGERRLFGLRSGPVEGDVLLADQSPPIEWAAASRLDDGATTSVSAWLRPLRVQVTLLGVGESSYFTVEAPAREECADRPEIYVGGTPLAIDSAPTEATFESRRQFSRQLDRATLERITSGAFEISYCGQRHGVEDETAAAFYVWATERLAAR